MNCPSSCVCPPKREPFVNGAEGCVRETRKGVLHDDDPHFSELFEALKNASACRKDFFDTLTQQGPAETGGALLGNKGRKSPGSAGRSRG